MLTLRDIDFAAPSALLAGYGLRLHRVDDDAPIPGSFWGEPEAGLIACDVFARDDTPVHSLLHEAAHLIVMPAERRATIHTDASDSVAEEDATCALQILLADALPEVGSARLMEDMDAWGYTFRLGSARAWFEGDAEDALAFLVERKLIKDVSTGMDDKAFVLSRESLSLACPRESDSAAYSGRKLSIRHQETSRQEQPLPNTPLQAGEGAKAGQVARAKRNPLTQPDM